MSYQTVWINDYEFNVGNGDFVMVLEDVKVDDPNFIDALRKLENHQEGLVRLVNSENVSNPRYTWDELIPIKHLIDPHYAIKLSPQLERQVASILINHAHLSEPTEKSLLHPGYVYLLQSSTGFYKIGRTKNPDNRLKTFGVKLPFEVEYLHLIETPDMIQLEKDLHKRFAIQKVNGEWFELSESDVQYIKRLAEQSHE